MKFLWAPWRIEYILAPKEGEGCFLCKGGENPEEEGSLVLHVGQKALVVLNRYPYNPGHLMVAPLRHVPSLVDLDREEREEIMDLLALSLEVLRDVMNPGGFNIGVNMGKAAGAGLKDHLHVHVVPRWDGDTNFMPALADVKVVPEHIEETYRKLKRAFQEAVGG
ncbi:MAG: HIT family hydrolase [Aquificota bacterium]|nr:MAG: HIT family hydrolase [Aquificota bacterium]